jgi:polyvinyl alcohol dehydrogenase (cytochrome)
MLYDWRNVMVCEILPWRIRNGLAAAAACGLLLLATPLALAEDNGDANSQWTMGGQNLNNGRNQPKTGINPQNVANLKSKWVFTSGGDVSATPAVAYGTVYFPDFAGNFYAVDAETGALKWKKTVSAWTGVPNDFARNDPLIYDNILILGDQAGTIASWDGHAINGAGARMIAVNARTGKLIWVSQVDTFPAAMITSSPVVYDGILYVGVASAEETLAETQGFPCCVSRGSVVALDVQTGKKLWQTYMVPDNNGTLGGYSGGAVWDSTPVVDPKRNLLYVGTGNNYSVPDSVETCFKSNPNDKFCTNMFDYFDAVVALDLKTGTVRWANRAMAYDAWNVNCIQSNPAGTVPGVNCPVPTGADYDFGGAGPNLFSVLENNDTSHDVLGVGEKSGVYWAFNPDDGSIIWSTQVGPGSSLGGIEWGTATDGERIYVPISNSKSVLYTLQPSNTSVNSGSWAALDPKTGSIAWQTATPGACSAKVGSAMQGCMGLGPASVAGGVVFVGSMDVDPSHPTMFALDARSGAVLWSFAPGSSVIAGPAIAGNSLYWGSGYGHLGPTFGTPNNKLFAFSIEDVGSQ